MNAPAKPQDINQASQTVRGKDRYRVRRDGISQDGLLGARLRAQGHRHHRLLPHHARRTASTRSRPRRRWRAKVRPRPGPWSGPTVSPRPRNTAPNATASIPCRTRRDSSSAYIAYDLDLFEPGSIANLSGLDHRQRVRLQAAEGAAARGHALSRRLCEDLPGAGDRHRRRARAARQVRPPAAGRHRQAEARPVRPQLRPRRLRGAEGRARLHQGRREHQFPALHALARPLPLLHGGGQQGAGGDRRGQGHLSQRHRRRRWRTCTSARNSRKRTRLRASS